MSSLTARSPRRQSVRPPVSPAVEVLEDRLVLNNRFVVPVGSGNGVTKFNNLHEALTTPGLAAGDVIQIEQGATPGALSDAMLPALPNLTIQGNSKVRAEDFLFAVNVVDKLSIT